jgi:hypothetical protein
LKEFFEFIGFPANSLDEHGRALLARAKNERDINENEYWIEDIILSFLDHQRQRVDRGEIVSNTLPTFYAPIRAFCGDQHHLQSADNKL